MRWLIMRWIRRLERQLGEPLPHLRDLYRVSPVAFFKFILLMPIATHRAVVSKEASHAARIAAILAGDCGACLQIVVNVALSEGVAPSVIEAAVKRHVLALDPAVAAAYSFAEAVVGQRSDVDRLRTYAVEYWGLKGVAELALAASAASAFPSLRRAMGHGTACQTVTVQRSEVSIPERIAQQDLEQMKLAS